MIQRFKSSYQCGRLSRRPQQLHLAHPRHAHPAIVRAVALDERRRLHLALLEQGSFAASRGLMCISTPMDEGHVDAISAGVGRALERLDLEPAMA